MKTTRWHIKETRLLKTTVQQKQSRKHASRFAYTPSRASVKIQGLRRVSSAKQLRVYIYSSDVTSGGSVAEVLFTRSKLANPPPSHDIHTTAPKTTVINTSKHIACPQTAATLILQTAQLGHLKGVSLVQSAEQLHSLPQNHIKVSQREVFVVRLVLCVCVRPQCSQSVSR